MTNTLTVEIPADVKDNSPHTVRVTSVDVRDAFGAQDLALYRREYGRYGYTMHETETVDRAGNRVTLTWFLSADSKALFLYETSYYTRTACAACVASDFRAQSYASVYQTVTDAEGRAAGPVPRCDMHADQFRRTLRGLPLTLHESERLRIGQHD